MPTIIDKFLEGKKDNGGNKGCNGHHYGVEKSLSEYKIERKSHARYYVVLEKIKKRCKHTPCSHAKTRWKQVPITITRHTNEGKEVKEKHLHFQTKIEARKGLSEYLE